jgi:hypothetical protein
MNKPKTSLVGITIKELVFVYNKIQNEKQNSTTEEKHRILLLAENTEYVSLNNHNEALADQKAKIWKWLMKNWGAGLIKKEFEELK